MESLRHDTFVPFIRSGLKSNNTSVVAASLRAAATHELKDVEKEARRLLKQKPPKKDKDPAAMHGEVGAAAIDYLARMDFRGEENFVVDEYLTPLLAFGMNDVRVGAPWAKDLLRASVHYVGKTKCKHAVAQLIEMVGEPQKKPFNPDKGDPNPPEEYWKARTQLWQASEAWVRWALKEVTGQEFRSTREWNAWYAENKKEYK
jgi:hypothetical protein